jgi:beta-N-acetylhexosaminidase
VLKALQAGADVAMWSSADRPTTVLDRLERAQATGELAAARIDQSIRRVLTAKSICSG